MTLLDVYCLCLQNKKCEVDVLSDIQQLLQSEGLLFKYYIYKVWAAGEGVLGREV